MKQKCRTYRLLLPAVSHYCQRHSPARRRCPRGREEAASASRPRRPRDLDRALRRRPRPCPAPGPCGGGTGSRGRWRRRDGGRPGMSFDLNATPPPAPPWTVPHRHRRPHCTPLRVREARARNENGFPRSWALGPFCITQTGPSWITSQPALYPF